MSNNTLITYSRTCSGASQLVTKSGFLQIRKNLQNNQYYLDKGKIKRDLSVETDICILRRYYRSKKKKSSNRGSSAKSKYSTLMDTEVETIEEFPDTSACGDNEISEIKSNAPIDIEALMLDNLKNLLNQWICKYLLYNKDTQHKFESVLDSILHKIERDLNDEKNELNRSSDSTYILDAAHRRQIKNKKKLPQTICNECRCKSCNDKTQMPYLGSKDSSSNSTIPHHKDIRIISTLSIPRIFHKQKLKVFRKKSRHHSSYKLKNNKDKHRKQQKKLESSNYNLMAISTKSLTKRCANYDINVKAMKKRIVFFPKPFYKSATEDSTSTSRHDKINKVNFLLKKSHLEDMPSVLQDIFINDMDVSTSCVDKNSQLNNKNDNYTMTGNISEEITTHSISHVTVNRNINLNNNADEQFNGNVAKKIVDENITYSSINQTFKNTTHSTQMESNIKHARKKPKRREKNTKKRRSHKIIRYTRASNKYNKHFRVLNKKTISKMVKRREFFKNCQNIFQFFTDYESNRNLKVDVRINVFPTGERGTKDASTTISDIVFPTLGAYETKGGSTLLYNVQSSKLESNPTCETCTPTVLESSPSIELSVPESKKEDQISDFQCTPGIIPLLDGAVSQAKYIFDISSQEKTDVQQTITERSNISNELEILQEINELRTVIKDLATTAEKFVTEQIHRESSKSKETPISVKASDNTSSSRCEAVISLLYPSKATQITSDFHKRLPQSVVRLANERKMDAFEFYNRLTKKSTSYRMIDSESVLKVTDMTSKANAVEKCSHQFTDEALTCSFPRSKSLFEIKSERNKRLVAFFCDNCVKSRGANKCYYSPPRCSHSKDMRKKKKHFWSKKKTVPCCTSSSGIRVATAGDCSSLGSCLDEEAGCRSCKQPRGLGFGEGCVYCLLLWIPVFLLLCLFYSFVIKDFLSFSEKDKAIGRTLKRSPIENFTDIRLRLSDLGF
ncbi:uncharacterized protein LOC142984070 [Anticarsia gemmatalis]|uniref:uncharacterized protein LOC142984070 n=1 Tax=Anticarsia gemmatalis TaxID=129554 RepID=UPI003F75B7AF